MEKSVDVLMQPPKKHHRGHVTTYARKLAWWIIIPLVLLTGAAIAVSF